MIDFVNSRRQPVAPGDESAVFQFTNEARFLCMVIAGGETDWRQDAAGVPVTNGFHGIEETVASQFPAGTLKSFDDETAESIAV